VRHAAQILGLVALATTASATLLDDIAAREDRTAAIVHDVAAAVLASDSGATADPAAASLPDDARPLAAPLRVLAAVRHEGPDRLARVRNLLDDWDDPRADRLRAHFESTDAARVASRLLADERHDRWAAAVNDTIRPFGLGTNLLAVVNPVLLAGTALDSILTAASHIRHLGRASAREHEALAAYGAAVDAAPGGRLDRDDARAADKLDRRVRRTICRQLAARAKDAYDDGHLAEASYLLRSPAGAECPKALHDLRDDVAGATRERDTRREASRWPATAPRLPRSRAEWDAYAAVARATVLGDAPAMVLEANRLAAGWPDGPNVPASRLVVAVARARSGHREAARRELEAIADGDGPGALVARDRLAALPDAEADAVDAAERRHGRDVAEYVLLGTGPTTRGAVRTAAQTGAAGVAGLPALGITNLIGVLTRAVLAWRHDPASNETVITEGEAYLAEHPSGKDAVEVRKRLVRAYERSERPDRALLHYQALPDPDPDRVRDLQNEIADQMLKRTAADPHDDTLLRAIVTLYPASKAAEKARPILAAHDTGDGVPIPRDALEEVPWLLGATGLGLRAGLLDGDDENGELDDAGVRVTPYAIECTLRGDGGEPTTETIPIAPSDAPRIFATVAEIARIHRANHPEGKDDEQGRWERLIPFFLQGTVGEGGVAVQPGIKLRPYEPSHPDRYQ
jgi:hypothetical protein